MTKRKLPFYSTLMCGISEYALAAAMSQMTKTNWEYWYGPLPELEQKGPSK